MNEKRLKENCSGSCNIESSQVVKAGFLSKNVASVPKKFDRENGDHGIFYQLMLNMNFIIRGLKNRNSSSVASEMEDAGKFEDIVIRNEKDGKINFTFIQAKHQGNRTTNITERHLKCDYSGFDLYTYYRSYLDFKHKFTSKTKVLRELIIFTNKTIEYNDGKFTFEDVFEIVNYESWEAIVNDVYGVYGTKFLRFRRNCDGRKQWVDYLASKAGSVEDAETFLNFLVFAVEQPGIKSLKEMLMEDINHTFNSVDAYFFYHVLQTEVFEWMTEGDGMKGTYFSYDRRKKLLEYANEKLRLAKSGRLRYGFDYPGENIVGREKELKFLRKASKETNRIVITGREGIGKSELARKFVAVNENNFQGIVWLDSESEESLSRSFRCLAQDILGVDRNVDMVDMKTVIEEVYDHLAGITCVIVFDNVVRPDVIFPYFRNSSYDAPLVLITSRYKYWGYARVLSLDPVVVVENEEISSLMKGILDCDNFFHNSNAKDDERRF